MSIPSQLWIYLTGKEKKNWKKINWVLQSENGIERYNMDLVKKTKNLS